MSQIALPLAPRSKDDPARIVLGSANRHVAEALQDAERWPFRTAVLTGPPRSGKSLLARWFEGAGKGEALDDADRRLDDLRGAYREMGPRERATLGAIAGPLRSRRDAFAVRIPRPKAVSDGAAVHDPEQDADPEAG